MAADWHPREGGSVFSRRETIMPLNRTERGCKGLRYGLIALATMLAMPATQAQTAGGQNPGQPPVSSQPANDIPDAPSAVQPPPPKSIAPPPASPDSIKPAESPQAPPENSAAASDADHQPPPPMPPVQTVPPGSVPRNQLSPQDDLYKLVVKVNFVQVPVMVKDPSGRRVDGLLANDFAVYENGKKQALTYFTSDPFQLSVALVLDLGMADVAVQKLNQTYSALVGAFSPYDEVSIYTYSSTVTQVTDFTSNNARLTAALNEMKLVRGHNNGPPVLSGPLGPQPPLINGIPVGTAGPPPVYTPPREAHVLNDAILRAALDLSKRPRTLRKVIFVISDGRELGSQASYRQVLKVLETQGIQVKAVVLDSGALPVFRQIEKIHLKDQGYSNILPRYSSATGGGQVFSELSRNAMEEAYAQVTSEARNQYTLGYVPKAIGGSSAYRSVEVVVDKANLKIYAKDGYYPIPSVH
jgi:VWFA-related protein